MASQEIEYLEIMEMVIEEQPSSLINDPIEEINIRTNEQPKILQIGFTLSIEEKTQLISFLKQNE